MLSISLPKKPKYEEYDAKSGRFVIEGCYPGYGTTVGNSLRRVLLSSLPGNAVVSVKVKGNTHEFSTIKGVKEDLVQIILNLKKVRFKLNGVEEAVVFLKIKGAREVTAADFTATSEVEVVNADQYIATMTSTSAELEMEVKIQRGLGFVPVDQQEREDKEIGVIAIDAIYSPIERVNFDVENMRIGKRTDFEKITLDVFTDGSISAKEAYEKSIEILMAQFEAVASIFEGAEDDLESSFVVDSDDKTINPDDEVSKVIDKDEKKEEDVLVETLDLSTRTLNVLKDNEIEKVSQLEEMTEEQLKDLEGMGNKGIKEIKKAIGVLGVTLNTDK